MRSRLVFVVSVAVLVCGCISPPRVSMPEGMRLVQEREFKVYAAQSWQRTDCKIEKGDFVRITASGIWTDFLESGPEGSGFITVWQWIVPPWQLFIPLNQMPFARRSALLAQFGTGRKVVVGRECSVVNQDGAFSAPLYFRVNDPVLASNSGALDVRLRIYRSDATAAHVPRPRPPGVPPEPRVAPPSPAIGARFALVVGVSKYRHAGKHGLANLVYADDDAKGVARALARQGWGEGHIRLLTNETATRENIRRALDSWLTKAGPNDLIVLYWSGHAFPDPADPDKVYFACYDTDARDPITGYRMDKVLAAIAERKARNVVVLADTCHAGKLLTRDISVVSHVERITREKAVPKGWVFMVGADKDRKAIEHTSWTNGAFTHCLLKGLAGAADAFQSAGARDGVVTLGELRTYLNTAMPEETHKVLGVAKRPIISTGSDDPDIWKLTLKAK